MRPHFLLSAFCLGWFTISAPAQWVAPPNSFAYSFQTGMGGSRLGVQLRDIDSNRAAVLKMGEVRGVEVVNVEENSPAEEAGIKAGDVLLSYNGESIVGAQQLGRLVSETPLNRKVKIELWRDGKVSNVAAVTAAGHGFNMPPMPAFDPGELENQVKQIALDIPKAGLFWRNSLLGVECESLDSQLAEYFGVKHGVLIRSVQKESAAEKAGLHAGDVITSVAEHSVASPKEVASLIRSQGRGTAPLALQITRDHKPLSVKVSF